jgi:hypothetical protein
MNCPALPRLALVAKTQPFFAPLATADQFVPDNRAKKNVRPENEVNDWLRPADYNEK